MLNRNIFEKYTFVNKTKTPFMRYIIKVLGLELGVNGSKLKKKSKKIIFQLNLFQERSLI